MPQTQFGTFDNLLAITEKRLQPILLRLRVILFEIDPKTCETVRLGDRAATYGLGAKKMTEGYVYILPHKNWVNLGFFRGAQLTETSKLLEGTGKNMRHIKIHTLEDIQHPDITLLIKAALTERKEALKNSN